jgi:hypothetical protein
VLIVISALTEISVHIACAVQNVNNVQVATRRFFVGVPEKGDAVAECRAAIARAQLGPRTSQETRKSGKVLAVAGELVYESFGHSAILTLSLNECRDLRDIASSRFAINEPRHSTRRSMLEAIELIACILAHFLGGEAPSFGFSGIKRGAKFRDFDLVDSMANGVLGRQKSTGGKLRLNPLGCVWCKFNFHCAFSFRKSFTYQGP